MSGELVRRSIRAKVRPRLGIPPLETREIPSRNYEVSNFELDSYLNFLEMDNVISILLKNDTCYMMSDAYLLASVFSYFQWSGLSGRWNRKDFFALLYLAIEIEEENSESKWELLPYALGDAWHSKMKSFISRKNELFKRMNFRGIVSKHTCDQVMALKPQHFIWKRMRVESHGGARRSFEEEKEYYPSGPNQDPLPCIVCGKVAESNLKRKRKVVAKAAPGLDVNDKSPSSKTHLIEDENNNEIIDYEQVKRLKLDGLDKSSFVNVLINNES